MDLTDKREGPTENIKLKDRREGQENENGSNIHKKFQRSKFSLKLLFCCSPKSDSSQDSEGESGDSRVLSQAEMAYIAIQVGDEDDDDLGDGDGDGDEDGEDDDDGGEEKDVD